MPAGSIACVCRLPDRFRSRTRWLPPGLLLQPAVSAVLGWMLFGVMTAGYLLLQVPTVYLEMHGNPAIERMGVDQALGSLEGKEMRLGAPASALWVVTTTVTSRWGTAEALPVERLRAILKAYPRP